MRPTGRVGQADPGAQGALREAQGARAAGNSRKLTLTAPRSAPERERCGLPALSGVSAQTGALGRLLAVCLSAYSLPIPWKHLDKSTLRHRRRSALSLSRSLLSALSLSCLLSLPVPCPCLLSLAPFSLLSRSHPPLSHTPPYSFSFPRNFPTTHAVPAVGKNSGGAGADANRRNHTRRVVLDRSRRTALCAGAVLRRGREEKGRRPGGKGRLTGVFPFVRQETGGGNCENLRVLRSVVSGRPALCTRAPGQSAKTA